MKNEEKPTKQYDMKLYLRKLKKANKELNRLKKVVDTCSTDELDEALRLYRAAELKVKQLEDRLNPPTNKFDMTVMSVNEPVYES